ncbi:MAG: exodeoxyribonuclease III [Candidatus Gracilibacteria bacterium]|nr:exodeoxyribonuclease III [Candidatus Gracilibacteria bacterium]
MKIISWNVNGIRAVAQKGFKEFISKENPDILCIQETKAFEAQFLKQVGNIDGYKYVWHTGTKAGYAGTAIFYKSDIEIIDTKNDFGEIDHFHDDGRVTELEFFYSPHSISPQGREVTQEKKHIVLLNGYFPNGGTRADGTEMVDYKLEFYDHLKNYTRNLKKAGKQVIVTGDFNICHTEIDIARPKENENSIGFLPIEREKIGEFISDGNLDVWRYLNPEKKDVYSWWSYRAGARPRNVGWRIDYFVVNKEFINDIIDINYMTEVMGSDHCPVMLKLR